MSLKTIKQFVLNIQTFRNIQLWYQGVYCLKFQIYYIKNKQTNQKIYAQPFALTQNNIINKNQSSQQNQGYYYDSQIISNSFIDTNKSSFITKAFHLKYFQQQVDINDLCHFRIEVDTFYKKQFQFQRPEIIMQVNLCFYDSYKKQTNQIQNFKNQSRQVRQIKYILKQYSNQQIVNQYIPILFQDQYFSLINATIHSFNVDYRFRMTNNLQLSNFTKLKQEEKLLLFEKIKNQTKNCKNIISNSLMKTLKTTNQKLILQNFKKLMKAQIQVGKILYKQYKKIFQFSITQIQINKYQKELIHPNHLQLFLNFQRQAFDSQKSELNLLQNNSQFLELKILTILNKINFISTKNIKLWQHFIGLMRINNKFCIAYYQNQYKNFQKLFWKEFVKHDKIQNQDITLSYKENFQIFLKQLQSKKLNVSFSNYVYDKKLFDRKNSLPLTIIQSFKYDYSEKINENFNFQFANQKKSKFQGIHLVILVHGFQGSSYDMKMIKNNISYLFPETVFHCCISNEEMTDSDIFQMGNRLAIQIKSFILENFPNNTLGKISFIGHSLGGLKIRACLPKLLDYKEKFHCYISFSSPHLGYRVNTSSVIEAGLWILQKMKQSQSLKQLSMADNQDLYQTTLYRLSLQEGFQYFKKIFLFSSAQDAYAPYESARIQIDPSFIGKNDPIKNIHCQMVKNIFKNIKRQSIHRVLINFTINNKNLDSFIGRTAHIMFLETAQIIKCLLYNEQNLFG